MKIKTFLLALSIWLFGSSTVLAQAVDYSNDATYKELYNAMHHAFNDGDSAKFFPAVKALQQYLIDKKDLHGYYTQRCNEIVFEMNQQRIYEAYKMARELSKELREKMVDKEMYMAMNMMGHINQRKSKSSRPLTASSWRYSGSKVTYPVSSLTRPLCLGMPNFDFSGEWK